MECFTNIDDFLKLLHTNTNNNFNFGTVVLNLYTILGTIPEPARRILLSPQTTGTAASDTAAAKRAQFLDMVEYIGACVKDDRLKPYVRHLIAVFEYMRNNSASNLSICKMSTSEPFINLKFKTSNVYGAMCNPRRFINQIKNATAPKPRAFDKYTNPEFISDVTDLITYSTVNEDGIAETRRLVEQCLRLESQTRTDAYDDQQQHAGHERAPSDREFEETYFKRMYRYACEISLQSEMYASCNCTGTTSTRVAYSMFLNFRMH